MTFTVSIQVIKVYEVEVEAANVEEAKRKANSMSSIEIDNTGFVTNIETGYAEIIE